MDNKSKQEQVRVVSRPSNEEVQEDEAGTLYTSDENHPYENSIIKKKHHEPNSNEGIED